MSAVLLDTRRAAASAVSVEAKNYRLRRVLTEVAAWRWPPC